MPSASDMMSAVNIAKSNPLSAGSLFKNPAAGALNEVSELTGKLGAVFPSDNADFISFSNSMGSFTSLANTNTAAKLSSISRTMPIAASYQAMKNSMAAVDGASAAAGAISSISCSDP